MRNPHSSFDACKRHTLHQDVLLQEYARAHDTSPKHFPGDSLAFDLSARFLPVSMSILGPESVQASPGIDRAKRLQCLCLFAEPTYDASGELADGGSDLSLGGVTE